MECHSLKYWTHWAADSYTEIQVVETNRIQTPQRKLTLKLFSQSEFTIKKQIDQTIVFFRCCFYANINNDFFRSTVRCHEPIFTSHSLLKASFQHFLKCKKPVINDWLFLVAGTGISRRASQSEWTSKGALLWKPNCCAILFLCHIPSFNPPAWLRLGHKKNLSQRLRFS